MIALQKKAHYYIEMTGISSDIVGDVTIDNKYALIQIHPTSSVAIVPFIGVPQPEIELAVFYSNCLAYEHDLPVFLHPIKEKPFIKPVKKTNIKRYDSSYFDIMTQAYGMLYDLRFGLSSTLFKYSSFDEATDIRLIDKYHMVEKEISIYTSALRQFDPLSEYLNYYRVIESVSKDNGKSWINININRIKEYNYGVVNIVGIGDQERKMNIFSIYKRRAVSRLSVLKKKMAGNSIIHYLYNDNRCGIAHGKEAKQFDFSTNVYEIAEDIYIMKLLARLAIEDKMITLS